MWTSLLSVRNTALGAVGAGMLTGAMLFGGVPVAQAAPQPTLGTSFAIAGPHGAPGIPTKGGPGGGGGHGGGGGGGHGGGWGGPGGGHGGGWGGHGGGWGGGWGGGVGRGWGHPGWGNGGWGPPGLGFRPWWSSWW